jgi:hypothetical protein
MSSTDAEQRIRTGTAGVRAVKARLKPPPTISPRWHRRPH